jgi:RNA polymerase sigma factor (sigma-70 family)
MVAHPSFLKIREAPPLFIDTHPDLLSSRYSLESLYRQYAPALREFCRRRLEGDAFEAEDACHEAIMKAHRALAKTRPHKMWPWLATIAANVCTDIIRKRARVVYLDVQRTPSSSDPEQDDAVAELRAQILVKAMDGLPRSYRELIRDHEYRKLSYQEMASRHQMSVGAVGSTLLRARTACRICGPPLTREPLHPRPPNAGRPPPPLPACRGCPSRLKGLLSLGPQIRRSSAPLR